MSLADVCLVVFKCSSLSLRGFNLKRAQWGAPVVPWALYDYLANRSANEGRSLGGLCACLLDYSREQNIGVK